VRREPDSSGRSRFSHLCFARRNCMTKNNTTTYSARGHPSRHARFEILPSFAA
jgi:hypothetical protein